MIGSATPSVSARKGDKILPEQSTVRARGLSLRLSRWHVGTGGAPLLFLNGIGADASAAAPLLRRISGREVWTLDMPGTGGSPDCLWPYSAQSMAAAIMDVVEQFGYPIIDLAGFSWGGALAQQIAGQFPDQIRHLILIATASHIGAADIGWGAIFDRDMLAGGLKIPASSPLGLTYQSLAMAGWSSTPLWPRIRRLPILMINGSQDQVVPPTHGAALARDLQVKRHVLISGGHLFPFTKAAETAAEINAFLESEPLHTPASEAAF